MRRGIYHDSIHLDYQQSINFNGKLFFLIERIKLYERSI